MTSSGWGPNYARIRMHRLPNKAVVYAILVFTFFNLARFSELSSVSFKTSKRRCRVPTGPNATAVTGFLECYGPRHIHPRINGAGRHQQRIHMHIGKAGGSSIIKLMKKSREHCMKLNKQPTTKRHADAAETKFHTDVCAIGKGIRRWHVAKPGPDNETSWFSNARDPVGRLQSWYYFEQAVVGISQIFPKNDLENAHLLGRCYDDFPELVQDCLLTTREKTPTRLATYGNTTVECRPFALSCLTGKIKCFAHNYYNYRFYAERLVVMHGLANVNPRTKLTKNINVNRIPRYDILRLEHFHDDFRGMMELWTGGPPSEQFLSLYQQENSFESISSNETKPKKLNQEQTTALCRLLCEEMKFYKRLIWLADNLGVEDVMQSFQELDRKCRFNVDEVCGIELEL